MNASASPDDVSGVPVAAGGQRRPRYGRDWLIAAGSLVVFIGAAFPLYLAWRDGRRGWTRIGWTLVIAGVACIPVAGTTAARDLGAALAVAIWLAGILTAVWLAATVPAEHRCASAREIRGYRRAAVNARLLVAGGVGPQDARPRDVTALTERVVVLEGFFEVGRWSLRDRHGRPLGEITSSEPAPQGQRARKELRTPAGALVMALDRAAPGVGALEVIVDDDGDELAFLRGIPAEPGGGRRARARSLLVDRWQRSIHAPDGTLVGRLTRPPDGRRRRVFVVSDAGGRPVARMTLTPGRSGLSHSRFVIEVGDGADLRLRAPALFIAVLLGG